MLRIHGTMHPGQHLQRPVRTPCICQANVQTQTHANSAQSLDKSTAMSISSSEAPGIDQICLVPSDTLFPTHLGRHGCTLPQTCTRNDLQELQIRVIAKQHASLQPTFFLLVESVFDLHLSDLLQDCAANLCGWTTKSSASQCPL